MTHTKRWYRFGFLALMVAASACAAQGPGESGEGDEPVDEAQAATDGHKGWEGKRRGGDKLIKAALELELTDAQRTTIEALRNDAAPPDHAGWKDFMSALASGVRANAIDEKAMEGKIAALSTAGSEMRTKHAAALEKLHATLTPAQRKELVEKIQAKMAKKEAKWAEKREAFEGRGEGFEGKKRGGKGPLAHMMKQLDLSDAQREAVKKAVADVGVAPDHEAMESRFEAMHAQKKALVAAFASESFDADALLPQHEDKGKEHLTKMVSATRAVLPILDAAQREKLAAALESGEMGRFGKHGKRGARHGAESE